MKELDLSMLGQTDSAYEKAAIALNEKYKGFWDDEVHNSFHLLLDQIEENRARIHSCATDAVEEYHAAVELDVEGLCRTAESLCREVETL